ncbi:MULTISPECIES: GAF domain-containing protein [Catenuloplanes]|uniref:GAF domain-containing protein n=1 Tax=Catenuloplanes niger TaxID=587534 RepID=A0AAE4CSR7_9ACTN|nr:GAF domain-containing protein [Catenuloplanes niger]MDR7322587.1 GAF domain-containing protein [Catenuloplanes niger]
MDLVSVLRHVTHIARRTLPGSTDVSVTIVEGRRPYTVASTGETAAQLDELQYQIKDGPCLRAATEKAVVHIRETAQDTRFHRWPAQAAAAGAGSILSVPLTILEDVDGALNVYGRVADAFDDDTVLAARAFAEYAGAVLSNAHLYDRTATLAEQMRTVSVVVVS